MTASIDDTRSLSGNLDDESARPTPEQRREPSSGHIAYGAGRTDTLPWTDRLDPLYELEHNDVIEAKWTAERVIRPELQVTDAGVVSPVLAETDVVTNRPANLTHNGRAVLVMAALSEFNHLTSAQLGCLIGMKTGYAQATCEELLLAGCLKRLDMGAAHRNDKSFGDVWRIDRSVLNGNLSRWTSRLSALEWALISNGVPFDEKPGTNAPWGLPHNLMTSEVMIRAMETNPAVVGIWGERHARMVNMYRAHAREKKARMNSGDGIIVTRSGKIIVLETTGEKLLKKRRFSKKDSTKENRNRLVDKVGGWVAATGHSELDLRVVFLSTQRKPDLAELKLYVGYGVDEGSKKYVTRRSVRERGKKRIYVADARTWFPAARSISDDFLWMSAHNAGTRRADTVIDDSDLVTDPTNDLVRNTLAGLHVPGWINNLPDLKLA